MTVVAHLVAILPPSAVSGRLRELGGFDALGPHITVKAQDGLDDVSRDRWLPAVRQALAEVEPFTVRLGPVGVFDDRVAFLEVDADEVHDVHRALVDVVRKQVPAGSLELAGWHPHLTLRLGQGFDLDEVRAGVAGLGPLPPFTVDEVWLCRQDGASPFVPELAIPLGPSRAGG